MDLQQAGLALKADNVLSGTVRKTSGGFRVSVQLVHVADGSSYWGESYDVATEELPGLEDRITEKVAGVLGIRLTSPEKARIYRRYTANAAAYEAYLRGRAHLVRSTQEGMAAAAEAFDEALRLDPTYALAHAGLAMASAEMHLRFAPEGEVKAWGEAARTQAQRALELDPNLAEVHQALAAVYGKTDFEWEKTIEESHRALELNPRLELPHSFLARAFYHLGLLEAADEKVREALALDPENRTEPIRAQGIVARPRGPVRRCRAASRGGATDERQATLRLVPRTGLLLQQGTSHGARPCSRSSVAPPPHPPPLEHARRSPASWPRGASAPGLRTLSGK